MQDYANDKKPALAAALKTAFDPAKSIACIRAFSTRRRAALPARGRRPAWPIVDYVADPLVADTADHDVVEASPAETGEIDITSSDLPAFLTEDEPAGVTLNGAAAV